jgi:uncharacterized damage-inducible protein DinB
MPASDLGNKFDYDYWASRQLLQTCADTNFTERMLKLFSHIIAAQEIWISRLEGKNSALLPWEPISRREFAERLKANHEKLVYMSENFNPDASITYSNTKGKSFSNSVKEILDHLVLHSQYHRAQIATEIKHQGGEVPATDYIFYKRARA